VEKAEAAKTMLLRYCQVERNLFPTMDPEHIYVKGAYADVVLPAVLSTYPSYDWEMHEHMEELGNAN